MKRTIGQLFIIGFPGTPPPAPFLSFVNEEKIGGVILFEENCPDASVARETLDTIRNNSRFAIPFLAIDQEGGRVVRLRGVPAEYRAAGDYAAKGDVEKFKEEYGRSAGFLDSLGFNLNLAPVADVLINSSNPCMVGRCFGDKPEIAARFVQASIQVSHANGLMSCLKHFPGLGASSIDPHQAVAYAEYDRTIWQQRERIPFAAGVLAGADLIMTTHVVVPKLDETMVTGSKSIVTDLIRNDLGFDGPVITDDLTMSGADELGSMGERTVAAFNAGHDILLFGRNYEAAMEAYDYFCDAVQRNEVEPARLHQSLERVAGLKYRLEQSFSR